MKRIFLEDENNQEVWFTSDEYEEYLYLERRERSETEDIENEMAEIEAMDEDEVCKKYNVDNKEEILTLLLEELR
jgi:DNA polymerase elongation subunit (family B)